jgi:hypothetical protein
MRRASLIHSFHSLCCEPKAAVSNLSRAAARRPAVLHQDVSTLILGRSILLLETEVHGARVHALHVARCIEFLQSLLEACITVELRIATWSISGGSRGKRSLLVQMILLCLIGL